LIFRSFSARTEDRQVSRNAILPLDALIFLLAAAVVSAAGFLWVEYTVPGVWPPWIGLPAELGW
jgi:hypothetical protein